MRIGLMLRHLRKQAGGSGTYTNMMLAHMLAADRGNDYVLLYEDPALLGSYAEHPNVTEVAVRTGSKLVWDQVVAPWLARRHRVDALFNLKTAAPFLAPCPTMVVQHGADWFVMPEQYPLSDRLYVKLFAGLYWRRADRIVAVSEDTRWRLAKLMDRATAAKLRTVYHGVDGRFFAPPDPQALDRLRTQYDLRKPFVLYLGQIYPMKNVGGLIRAFARLRDRIGHDLVLVGKPSARSAGELALIDELGIGGRVRRVGWVPDEQTPLFFHAADLLAFPSLYEGFGIPIVEAMASGCPVVTSTAGSCPEVAGDAAILVDPHDPQAIAEGIHRGLTDLALREDLRRRGLARARQFSWETAARQTIGIIEEMVAARAAPRT